MKKTNAASKVRQASLSDAIHLYEKIYLSARWRRPVRGLRAKANDCNESACGEKRD
jgi:hypothetical protein